MQEVVIVNAVRTPIGKFNGAFKDTTAVELGTIAVKECLKRANLKANVIDQVILGNVLQAGNGQNPARQVGLNAGVPKTAPAVTINQVCGSGLKAVILGQQAIQLGNAQTVIVGGIENMSQAPLLAQRGQQPDTTVTIDDLDDSLFHDGLTDAFSQQAMGLTAEAVAEKYQVSRMAQDTYALNSQLKAAQAQTNGLFAKEIVPIELPSGEIIATDQGVRPNSTLEKLKSLKTVFKEDGTVTAGNASTINDGAAVLILMAKDAAETQNIPYLATLGAYTEIGTDPDYMGYAPFYAIGRLLDTLALTPDDVDVYEINEAFASQAVAVTRDLNLPIDRVNPVGGAIALGHPLGASGARILTTLVHTLEREEQHLGIASLCVGGGIGLALAISR